MSCAPNWSGFGLALIGAAFGLVGLPLSFILWAVFAGMISYHPPEIDP